MGIRVSRLLEDIPLCTFCQTAAVVERDEGHVLDLSSVCHPNDVTEGDVFVKSVSKTILFDSRKKKETPPPSKKNVKTIVRTVSESKPVSFSIKEKSVVRHGTSNNLEAPAGKPVRFPPQTSGRITPEKRDVPIARKRSDLHSCSSSLSGLTTPGSSRTPRPQGLVRLFNPRGVGTQSLDFVKSDSKEAVDTVRKSPKGAYLVFSPSRDGCFFIQWSEKFIPHCWLFSRPAPGSNIPVYKFSSSAKEQIAQRICLSSDKYYSSLLLFIRHVKQYKGCLYLLEPFLDPSETHEMLEPVVLGFHHTTSCQVHVPVRSTSRCVENLAMYDGVVAIAEATGGAFLLEMANESLEKNISLAAFLSVGNSYGASMSFQETP